MTFFLKRSKINTSHSKVKIWITAQLGDLLCAVAAAVRLQNRDPQSDSAPLFAFTLKSFIREAVRAVL